MKNDYATDPHCLSYAFLFKRRMYFCEWKGLSRPTVRRLREELVSIVESQVTSAVQDVVRAEVSAGLQDIRDQLSDNPTPTPTDCAHQQVTPHAHTPSILGTVVRLLAIMSQLSEVWPILYMKATAWFKGQMQCPKRLSPLPPSLGGTTAAKKPTFYPWHSWPWMTFTLNDAWHTRAP